MTNLNTYLELRQLKERYDTDDIHRRWGTIRELYRRNLPRLLSAGLRWASPYFADWYPYFSEPEQIAWCAIRSRRLALYPQVPLFNWFIDFANPSIRVGLEIDGTQHDPNKDRVRDTELAEYGWRIFRVPARECYVSFKDDYEIEVMRQFDPAGAAEAKKHRVLETCDGVVEALNAVYLENVFETGDGRDQDLYSQTLNWHRLVEFDLLQS